MKYSEFIEKYDGKAVDYDGAAGAQCVDLIKLYLDKVFNIAPFSIDNSAKNYFYKFNSFAALRDKFTRITNTPDFVPNKGDICVFGSKVGGGHGHVSIATGEGTTTYFYSYDMNWNGAACHRVKHKYVKDDFLGVLRPDDRSSVGITYPKCGNSHTSLVDALNSIKVNSSYANRRNIAKANGISGYIGTAKQNTQLLNLLKQGKLIKA